jgi:NitT/TauT family transport system substrate-binding protein
MNRFRALLLLAALVFSAPAVGQMRLLVALPGPLNVSYLPLDLASKIGADTAEGVELALRHVGGGGVALHLLQSREVDFAIAGAPAAMSAKANGNDVVVIASVDDLTLFVLMVRSDLKDKIRRVRDLAGRVIGVNTSSLSSKTTSQQLAELLLRNDGISPGHVRIVAAGQSWDEQSVLIRSKAADAILGDEPFASRLRDDGQVFFLVNLARAADAERIPGAGFLHAAVETRSDVLRDAPKKAEKLVAVLRRTLAWMASHTPEEIVAALRIDDAPARQALLRALRQYSRLYSPDGRFSARQIRETDIFFASSEGGAKRVLLGDMIDARWAGRKP